MMRQKNRTYEQASKHIQENLKKHLEKNENLDVSDSDEESDDDTDKLQRIIDGYSNSSGGKLDSDFVKNVVVGLKNVLTSTSCLICISSVKKTDAIWSCDNCYNTFHINCIQKWAKARTLKRRILTSKLYKYEIVSVLLVLFLTPVLTSCYYQKSISSLIVLG